MALSYIDSAWPIVEVLVRSRFTQADAELLIQQFDRIVARNAPHVMIAESSFAHLPEAAAMRVLTQWMSAHRQDILTLNRGTALVLSSALARGSLRAMLHLVELSFEYELFDTLDQARTWAAERAKLIPADKPRADGGG